MNISQFSIQRPVITTMITLIILVLGIVSFTRLQIDLLPSIELPTVSVRTSFEGASPEIMEQTVTQIIEEIIATVPGIEEISSTSSEGSSNVRVTFSWGTNIDTAALDLQATIEDEINELPDDIVRPRIWKFDIDSFPVVLIGISSNLDPLELTQLIEDHLRYRFTRVSGVAQVDLWGGFDREVRIEIDPDKVNALGLSFDQIIQSIRDSNLNFPAGKIEQGRYEVTLRAPAQYQNMQDIKDTVLDIRQGAPVTISQIAEVKDTYKKLTRIIRINGEQGVRIAIRKQAQANTVEVSQGILKEIDEINKDFPQIKIIPVINQGNFIERSIKNVARSVLYGGSLAILILLFFLRNIRSTFIISLAIPISIIATFALIYFNGLTINMMTLGGLALGVGMMVDNSIVVLENIFRRKKENHESAFIAAIEGAKEVSSAIIASTITTLVIFLPLVFVRGVTGLLFKDLAYVIVFSLLCSLLVSLSIVPMISAKLFSDKIKNNQILWFQHLSIQAELIFNRMDLAFQNLLQKALNHRMHVVFISCSILIISLLLIPWIGTEFMPPSDEGEVRVSGEMEVGSRLDLVNKQTQLIENIVYPSVPETLSTVTSIRNNSGEINIALKSTHDRNRSNLTIAEDLRQKLEGQIPGMKIRTRAPQGQFLLDRILGGNEGITIEIRGYEFSILKDLSYKVFTTIQDIDGITDIKESLEEGIPQQEIQLDRKKIADLGLTIREVTEVIETAIAGSSAGNYQNQGHSYRILVQLKDAEKKSIDEVLNLTMTTKDGQQVALRNFVHTQANHAPAEITRKDQQRQVTVQANISGRDLGSVAQDIKKKLKQIPLPSGFDIHLSGSFEEQQKAFTDLLGSLVLALLLVYMVLAGQYETFKDPLIIMLSTTMALSGVVFTLIITKTTLNLQSGIGCIMLGGIVVNNAILLVDQALKLTQQGMSVDEAVAESGRRRLRPILMTTLTTILGLLPLAFGIGEGADAQAPLARVVIGGLAGSTLITLVLIPVVFSMIHSDKNLQKKPTAS